MSKLTAKIKSLSFCTIRRQTAGSSCMRRCCNTVGKAERGRNPASIKPCRQPEAALTDGFGSFCWWDVLASSGKLCSPLMLQALLTISRKICVPDFFSLLCTILHACVCCPSNMTCILHACVCCPPNMTCMTLKSPEESARVHAKTSKKHLPAQNTIIARSLF